MNIINLERCPFCGGEAKPAEARTEDGAPSYSVICSKCHTGIFRARVGEANDWDGYQNIYDAVAAYNRRASDDE